MLRVSQSLPFPHASVQEVVIVYAHRGSGVEGDPYREVLQVHSKDGVLIAEQDYWVQYSDTPKPLR